MTGLLIKRTKLFAEIFKYKITKQRKPIVAYLLLTDKCNRRCRYCFVDPSKKKKELNFKQWKKVIDVLVAKGCKMFCLMGGEPLIYPEIDQIVDYIKKKNVICDMTSNGILVRNKIATVKKLDGLMISLDGDRKATDANRGEGAYQKALEAIKIARENGVTVRINSVLTKQNKNCLKFLLKLADKYNLFVTYSILAEFPEKEKKLAGKIILDDEEIKQVYRQLKKWKKQGKRILFSQNTLDYVINYPLPYKKIILKNDSWASYSDFNCLFGKVMFYIDSNGDFYPCAALWNSQYYRPLNIIKDGFLKSWKNLGNLECKSCFCPGVPEWERMTSLSGIIDGVKVTLTQLLGKNG